MAENMKEIKERIDSVKNTNQITNAMNIVSSTKFKKFQILTLKSREYSKTIEIAFDNLVAGLKSHRYEIFDGKPEVKKIGIVVMTSDRGLCGSFNSNTLRKLEEMKKNFEKENKEVSVVTIGKKAKDYCKSRNITEDSEYTHLIPETMFEKAKVISEDIVDFYLNDHYDEVYIIYSKFVSVISYNLVEEKLLPFSKPESIKEKVVDSKKGKRYIFEPDENNVLIEFLPKMLNNRLYQAFLETSASEHSARMSAMKNASDNATEMIDKLTLEYNRVRQGLITQELTEIISGSQAIK